MNFGQREDGNCCYFHPRGEALVGVCPVCLNERLLVLAAKQGFGSSTSRAHSTKFRQPIINLPKIFAFGSLLNFPHSKPHHSLDLDASPESYISIKFEENGAASWEKGKVSKSKVSLEHCSVSWKPNKEAQNQNQNQNQQKSVIEHAKSHHAPLRWRKRIGQIFHLVRWKRSNKPTVGTKAEAVKITRKNWIRTLTKRAKE